LNWGIFIKKAIFNRGMFVNTLNPTLLRIGFLEIRYYGLVYALGFLLVYYFLNRKKEELEASEDQIVSLTIALVIGLLVGARAFHFLFSEPSIFIKDPSELFRIWHGGMSFFGALLGCFLGAYFYLKKQHLSVLKFSDIVVIPATIALVLGRIANFINGELVGTATNLPWCVIFPNFDNICRHPYQLYASFSHLVLLGLLLWVAKIKAQENLKEGIMFCSFLVGYSMLRFITDFVREDPRFLGMTVWQYISTIVFVIGVLGLRKKLGRNS
jgi:phosphatidylglycerol:prolipoprotein diacylglycerol transferase